MLKIDSLPSFSALQYTVTAKGTASSMTHRIGKWLSLINIKLLWC